jgi:hypothetical protein
MVINLTCVPQSGHRMGFFYTTGFAIFQPEDENRPSCLHIGVWNNQRQWTLSNTMGTDIPVLASGGGGGTVGFWTEWCTLFAVVTSMVVKIVVLLAGVLCRSKNGYKNFRKKKSPSSYHLKYDIIFWSFLLNAAWIQHFCVLLRGT